VIIILPHDGTAAQQQQPKRVSGVKVICTTADPRDGCGRLHVTFDSISVARRSAVLVDKATGTGQPLYLYAGAARQQRLLFFEGEELLQRRSPTAPS